MKSAARSRWWRINHRRPRRSLIDGVRAELVVIRTTRIRSVLGISVLLAGSLVWSAVAGDFTLMRAEAAEHPVQSHVVRTTGGIDTTGWVLIAVLHGPDAALVEEGQQVRAFSVNARTRLHLARVTRVRRMENGVRIEARLASRVLGTSTRYLMEIVTASI